MNEKTGIKVVEQFFCCKIIKCIKHLNIIINNIYESDRKCTENRTSEQKKKTFY